MWMEHMIAHLFLGLKNYHQVLCVFTWVRTFGPPYFLISNKNCIKIKHPKYTIGVLREKYNQTHYNAQTCLFFFFFFFWGEWKATLQSNEVRRKKGFNFKDRLFTSLKTYSISFSPKMPHDAMWYLLPKCNVSMPTKITLPSCKYGVQINSKPLSITRKR